MKKPRKRLDRPSFWKWAIPLVLGLVVLVILGRSGAFRLAGELYTGLNARDAMVLAQGAAGLVMLLLMLLLAMALARRFRDIGWPAWIGPTILLVTLLGPPFFFAGYQSYALSTYGYEVWNDIRVQASYVVRISESVSLVLVIVAGSMPGKSARAQRIEVAQVFE